LFEKPHRLVRVVSEYNGRQALSWGGWGLEAIDCKFNHTGRVINHGGGLDDGLPIDTSPSAGVDIEPNQGSFARDGLFIRCEFIDNAGAGLAADVGDGGYSTFDDCTFWATTNYSIWANRPGLRFINSRIHGTGVHVHDGHSDESPSVPNPELATYFEGCTFEDKPWTDGKVRRAGSLYNIGPEEGHGVTFKNCTFRNHETRAISVGGDETEEIFEGCTFIHEHSGLAGGAAQATFSGSQLRSVHFQESSAIANGAKNYYIGATNVTVAPPAAGEAATHVDGPRVKWDSTNGPTGDIAPGSY
jgi:hypothetical protein